MSATGIGDALWLSKSADYGKRRGTKYWTPLDLKPKFFGRASDGIVTTSGRVSKWEDASPWRWYAEQPVSGERPVMDAISGRPVIKFTAANLETLHQYQQRQYPAGNSTWWVIARWRVLDTEGHAFCVSPTGHELRCAGFGSDLAWVISTEVIQPALNAGAGLMGMLATANHDTLTGEAFRMVSGAWSSQGTTAITTGTTPLLDLSFGGRIFNSPTWEQFCGDVDVAEAFFVDRILTSAEMGRSANYLTRRYGL